MMSHRLDQRSRVLAVAVFASGLAACLHSAPVLIDVPDRPTVEMLSGSSGSIGWNGIRLGMTRREVESVLKSHIAVRPDDFAEVCGPFYSLKHVAGREVYVQWSSDGADGRVELIHVPLVGSERTMSAEQLANRAMGLISTLVDAPVNPHFSGAPDSAHLVLEDQPGMSLLLKPSAPDEALYVSYLECLD